MIIEGLLATTSADGGFHLAPMGPRVTGDFEKLLLRPFEGSESLENLRRNRRGVFHLTDDVMLLARAAIHQLKETPQHVPTPSGKALRLADCCRWFEFEVESISDTSPRIDIECRVVDQGFVRHWTGFNRAKHAVLEAAILCTRIGILSNEEIAADFAKLEVIVYKTASPREDAAFTLLWNYFKASHTGGMP